MGYRRYLRYIYCNCVIQTGLVCQHYFSRTRKIRTIRLIFKIILYYFFFDSFIVLCVFLYLGICYECISCVRVRKCIVEDEGVKVSCARNLKNTVKHLQRSRIKFIGFFLFFSFLFLLSWNRRVRVFETAFTVSTAVESGWCWCLYIYFF